MSNFKIQIFNISKFQNSEILKLYLQSVAACLYGRWRDAKAVPPQERCLLWRQKEISFVAAQDISSIATAEISSAATAHIFSEAAEDISSLATEDISSVAAQEFFSVATQDLFCCRHKL